MILKVAPISLELTLDPDRIIQTLTNLLSNAIKFTDPGKIVSLEAEEVEGSGHVQVGDQGQGIPPEKLEQIFDRFQQVHSADARQKRQWLRVSYLSNDRAATWGSDLGGELFGLGQHLVICIFPSEYMKCMNDPQPNHRSNSSLILCRSRSALNVSRIC